MNWFFNLLAFAIGAFIVFIGLEIIHDKEKPMAVGIGGCFFLGLAAVCVSAIDVDTHGWDNLPLGLLIAAIPAIIGIILLYVWKKDK